MCEWRHPEHTHELGDRLIGVDNAAASSTPEAWWHATRGANDAQYSVFWDDAIGKYVTYTRMKPADPKADDYWKRRFGVSGRKVDLAVGRQTSEDFLHWSDELWFYFAGLDVRSLPGEPVRLRFVMRDTKLYAFQFLGEQRGERATCAKDAAHRQLNAPG